MLRTVPIACVIAALLVASASPARGQDSVEEPPHGSAPAVVPGAPPPAEPPLTPVQPLSLGAPPAAIHERRTGLLVAGTALFGLIYGITLMGSIISSNGTDGPCSDCLSQSALWAIPVAGPWVANLSAKPDARASTWFVATWSGIEAASLAMIIVGAIGHDVPGEPMAATPAKVSVVPLLTPQAEMLSLRTSW